MAPCHSHCFPGASNQDIFEHDDDAHHDDSDVDGDGVKMVAFLREGGC